MKSKLIARTIQRAFWAGILLGSAVAVSAAPLVTFQVDMSVQVTAGTFVPGTDTVSAHGTFNGWGAGLNLTNDPAAANTNLYTGSAADTSDVAGGVLIYKYVQDTSYESTADSQNRCAQLPAGGANLVLPASFYNDAGPSITANVTFQIDMAEQIHLGTFDPTSGATVEAHGSFNGWSGGDTLTNDPTILTTNATGTIASNVFVGTFAITGPTNGTQEYKYVTQPGTVYEGPSSTDADYDNSENRFFITTPQTLPIVSFSDQPLNVTVTNTVTFEVDMSIQSETGVFTNNQLQQVDVPGSYNSWTQVAMTNNPAASNTNIYSYTTQIVGAGGSQIAYKYIIQPGNGWENSSGSEFLNGNRVFNLATTNASFVVGPIYFGDAGPSTLIDLVSVTNCMVTFTVDMTPEVNSNNFTPGGDTVFLNGVNGGIANGFWTWGSIVDAPAAYAMTNTTGNLYSITVPVNQGQTLMQTYKYSIDGADNEAPPYDNHVRYVRSFPNYTMPTDVFGGQGNSTQSEISFGDLTVQKTNQMVSLSWLGRPGVHLQTAGALSGVTAWQPQIQTDGTNLIVAPGGMATTNYAVGTSNLFFELVGPQ